MGAVGATKTLQPGETWSQRFFLCWHFPKRPCNDKSSDAPDDAEPPVYTNMYAKHLANVDAVLAYITNTLTA